MATQVSSFRARPDGRSLSLKFLLLFFFLIYSACSRQTRKHALLSVFILTCSSSILESIWYQLQSLGSLGSCHLCIFPSLRKLAARTCMLYGRIPLLQIKCACWTMIHHEELGMLLAKEQAAELVLSFSQSRAPNLDNLFRTVSSMRGMSGSIRRHGVLMGNSALLYSSRCRYVTQMSTLTAYCVPPRNDKYCMLMVN